MVLQILRRILLYEVEENVEEEGLDLKQESVKIENVVKNSFWFHFDLVSNTKDRKGEQRAPKTKLP